MNIRQHIILFSAVISLFSYSHTVLAKVNLFACEPEWAALAKELGGEQLHIVTATTAKQDPHHIQARPSLIAKIRRADLLVCTGAELEIGWLPLLLRKSSNARIQLGKAGYFMATEQVELLGKPVALDRRMGDVHAAGNPHIQFDPHRIAQVAQALAERLSAIDPSHQNQYKKNLQHFLQHWTSSIKQWERKTKPLRGTSIVVQHQSWIYLEQWLGLTQLATLEPRPGIPPSSVHLSQVLAAMKKKPADFIIYADYQGNKATHWLAEKTNTPTVAIPFSVADGETLSQWYERVINLLLAAKS
ncbi:MAG: zinc ABC transporter substrate-binding protein [Gammaproteobacteria bacterium]|nr:zinc ABC transporter substrate-binding protein [Gammaproteobacteria bacterium]